MPREFFNLFLELLEQWIWKSQWTLIIVMARATRILFRLKYHKNQSMTRDVCNLYIKFETAHIQDVLWFLIFSFYHKASSIQCICYYNIVTKTHHSTLSIIHSHRFPLVLKEKIITVPYFMCIDLSSPATLGNI